MESPEAGRPAVAETQLGEKRRLDTASAATTQSEKMSDEPIGLLHEQRTMLMTLSMHALDAASPHPILGDQHAADLLARLDRSVPTSDPINRNLPVICTRARLVDDLTRSFLDQHREAVVVHAGCGLDSRVLRVDPGPGVRWFELDQDSVIALRNRVYPARDGVITIAASVTDSSWWARVPAGLPTLVVAEGLLMYLDPEAVAAVVRDVFGRSAPCTELIADAVAPWVSRVAGRHPTLSAAGTRFRSSSTDVTAAIAGANSAHASVVAAPPVSLPEQAAHRTRGATSLFLRAFAALPAGRRAMTLHTYAQGSDM